MSNDFSPERAAAGAAESEQAWWAPVLSYIGHVGDVVQGGGGKLSSVLADPGDNRKPSGGGGE